MLVRDREHRDPGGHGEHRWVVAAGDDHVGGGEDPSLNVARPVRARHLERDAVRQRSAKALQVGSVVVSGGLQLGHEHDVQVLG